MAMPINSPVIVASTKFRFRNTFSGMSGSVAVASAHTNRAENTMAVIMRLMIVAEPHSYSTPPQDAIRMIEVTATAMVSVPHTSNVNLVSCLGSFNTVAAMIMAIIPMGRFIQNTQRHPMLSANQPPSTGPTTLDRPNTAPITPMYLPRSRTGTMSAIMACDKIMSPPPPRPCTTRAIISQVILVANPPITDPMRNTVSAPRKSVFRPIMSPNLP